MTEARKTIDILTGGEGALGNETAPFLYVDGLRGALVANGVVRLRLIRSRHADGDEEIAHDVVAHVAMGLPTLLALHETLGDIIKTYREQGILPQADDATR